MKKVKMSDQSGEVQDFLEAVLAAGGAVIEDDNGNMRGSFMAYREPSAADIKKADEALLRIWKTTEAAMKKQGFTVDDVEKLLQSEK